MPSKTEAAKPTAPPAKITSKADFVRALPNLSPKEVVEKAKVEGVKFDVRYVYRVRAMDKTARKAKRVTKLARAIPAAVNGAAPTAKLPGVLLRRRSPPRRSRSPRA